VNQDSSDVWSQMAGQMQKTITDHWTTALQAMQTLAPNALPGGAAAPAAALPSITFSPEKLQELQQQYLRDATELWNKSLEGKLTPGDKRFAAQAWSANPMAAFSAATYLLNARTLMGLADAVQADEKTRARLRFAVEQWMAATAPSNFLAFNVEAQQKAIDTKGESIAKGCRTCCTTSARAMCR
jgi:polyhydroxyalkanoate synthase